MCDNCDYGTLEMTDYQCCCAHTMHGCANPTYNVVPCNCCGHRHHHHCMDFQMMFMAFKHMLDCALKNYYTKEEVDKNFQPKDKTDNED